MANQEADPEVLHRLRGLNDTVTALDFNPSVKQVAAASKDKSVLVWSFGDRTVQKAANDPNKAFKFTGHGDEVMDVGFSPSGKLLASASRDKTVRVWVNSIRGESSDFRGHSGSVRSVQFAPNGSQLLTGSDDKSVKVWSVQKHKFVASFLGHTNWVRCARYSPDGRMVASCSDDRSIRIFDERTTQPIHVFQEPKGYAQHLEFHPSGLCIGVGTTDKKVKIYDIRMQKLQQLYCSHDGPVTQVSFHASGNYLASSSMDGYIKMFDLLEARPIYDLRGHDNAVTAVKFSPKGDFIASGGTDHLVFVWRTNIDEGDVDLQGGEAKMEIADKINDARAEIAKTDDLAAKLRQVNIGSELNKENTDKMAAAKRHDDSDLKKENDRLKADLRRNEEKLEMLTETVVLMERRLTLLEDQIRCQQSLYESDLKSDA